jgi:hypothetical protein
MTTRRKPPNKPESFAAGVGRGMRRAARTAREVARMHGTPIYIWEHGKIVVTENPRVGGSIPSLATAAEAASSCVGS